MEAIEFVANYENYLAEIEQVVKPEFHPVIEQMKETDPHDLVRPDSWFQGSVNSRGYVWSLFLQEVKKSK